MTPGIRRVCLVSKGGSGNFQTLPVVWVLGFVVTNRVNVSWVSIVNRSAAISSTVPACPGQPRSASNRDWNVASGGTSVHLDLASAQDASRTWLVGAHLWVGVL